MRKWWNKLVQWLLNIPADKRLHFVAGFMVAAFFGLALGMKVVVVPALFAGFIKEFYDVWTTNKWEWLDFLATVLGGVLAQAFVLINVLCF